MASRKCVTTTMRDILLYLKMDNIDSIDNMELRRVQALHGERTLTIVLPKVLAVHLGIEKGDFLKYHVDGNRLIMEKVKT